MSRSTFKTDVHTLLNVYKSNKTEILFEALASVLNESVGDTFSPEWICVQSRGMKQWISIKLAEKFGICANTNFVFPKEIIELFLNCKKKSPETDDLFWHILSRLLNKSTLTDKTHPVAEYIANDLSGTKTFQLACQISRLFDDYQIYRPEMLDKWQSELSRFKFTDKDTAWQAKLWESISGDLEDKPFSHQAMELINSEVTSTPDHIAEIRRISLFGITSLPPLFIRIFERLSQSLDIHLFLMVPSNQFFHDLKSKKQISRLAVETENLDVKDTLYFEEGNSMFSSLGVSGREFNQLVETLDYYEPDTELFEEPTQVEPSMLSILQSDIYHLLSRKIGHAAEPLTIKETDRSVAIHACHTPMREAQVLKDILLDAFETDPLLKPHDIIVMMPDIEKYAPFIESVFSTEHSIPYSISDRKKHIESKFLTAFLKIFELRNQRFEKTSVMDLLLCEPVAKKFNINEEELPAIQNMVSSANILWGFDEKHRQIMGQPPEFLNTWEFGFQRLFLGMAMPDQVGQIFSGVVPCTEAEGPNLEILGKFAAFCDAFFSFMNQLNGKKQVDEWCKVIEKAVNNLLFQDSIYSEDAGNLLQTIHAIKKKADACGFSDSIPFEIIYHHIRQKLDFTLSQGNFLSGKITFCNLIPMRSIPYKIIVLMGMDEASFPRKITTPAFDLIKSHPKTGDKNQRNEDRYLFLETLLSARSRFIITYTGMSIQDNSILPPSGVVNELCDLIEQSFDFPSGYRYKTFHPLHAFDAEYFNGSLFSYSDLNLKLAQNLMAVSPSELVHISSDFENKDDSDFKNIDLDTLIRFYKSPLEFFMHQGIGIQLGASEEHESEREPFKISGLQQFKIGSRMIESALINNDAEDLFQLMKAEGVLPYSQKAKLEFERIYALTAAITDTCKSYIDHTPIPSFRSQISFVSDITLSGTVQGLNEKYACFIDFGKLNGKRILTGWIKHLFLNAAKNSTTPRETVLIGMGSSGKNKPALWLFDPLQNDVGRNILNSLVKLHLKGLRKPFYFAANLSFKLTQILEKKGFEITFQTVEEARLKCMDLWYGTRFFHGENQNRYTEYATAGFDPFKNHDTFIKSGLIDNSLAVFKPLFENVKQLA